MKYNFVKMNEPYAQEIVNWHYEGIYSFYDLAADPEDLEEFLDPANWEDRYFAVLNEHGQLVGMYLITFNDDVMWIGFGLKPELTGQGLGAGFVQAGIDFGIDHFSYQGDQVLLAVAIFNQRAIQLYKKIGFQETKKFMQKTNGGEYEFLEMCKMLKQ